MSRPPRPRRPYRDGVIGYAILAVLVVGIAALTGGHVLRAALIALVAFVLASAWSWWRLRAREQREKP